MKAKLNIHLLAAAVTLFMVSMTGYAMPGKSDRPVASGSITVENPAKAILGDNAEPGSEVTQNADVEDPGGVILDDKAKPGSEDAGKVAVEDKVSASETGSTKDSLVSKWLEARAREEGVVAAGNGKSSLQDDGMGIVGGGWCDYCGCWMRHGCDTNGNCNNNHGICGGGQSCYLHVGINCGQY